MNNLLLKLNTDKKYLFICLLLVVVIFLIFVAIIFISISPAKNVRPISPTSTPALQRNSAFDKNLAPGSAPSATALSQNELAFPQAKQQEFSGTTTGKGTLVVTSTIPDVTILIDTPNESEGSASNYVPSNIAPLVMNTIPEGYYLVDARKDGYNESQVIVRIDANKITRLTVSLQPLNSY